MYEVVALKCQRLYKQTDIYHVPEKTNDTVVEVGVAKVVGRNPDVKGVGNELRHDELPLAVTVSGLS